MKNPLFLTLVSTPKFSEQFGLPLVSCMCSRKMDIRNQAEADPLLMWKPINFLFIENFYVPKSLRYPEY